MFERVEWVVVMSFVEVFILFYLDVYKYVVGFMGLRGVNEYIKWIIDSCYDLYFVL